MLKSYKCSNMSNPSRISGLDCLKESTRVNMCESLCECMIMHVNICEYYIWWLMNSLIDAEQRFVPDAGAVVSGESDGRSMQRRVFLVLIEEIEP